MPLRSRSPLVVGLLVALGILALVTLVGLIDLWPSGREVQGPAGTGELVVESARVVSVTEGACRSDAVGAPGAGAAAFPAASGCRRVEVELQSGPDQGERVGFDLGGGFDIGVGDGVRVSDNMLPPDASIGGVMADPYSFADFERRAPLLWLTLAFVALVLVTARWRGLRALVGLTGSLGIVVLFVVPAILDGSSPLAVATVGALAIMLITIPLAHGLGAKAIAATLGTAMALLVTLTLASLFSGLAHITGFGSEEATFLRAGDQDLSIQGLLLAGIVIGALGVLDDLTVTQASTVVALRRANARLGAPELFRRALAVGHDHIVATVNTLVLAYVGASLPVLLVFSLAGQSFSDSVNSEVIAAEIVATLVGSIGLIAAVPITTGIAALLAVRLEPAELGAPDSHESGAHVH